MSRRCDGPPQIGPAEQLAAAQEHDPLGHKPKTALQRADGEMQTAFFGSLGRAENIVQPADLSLGLTDDEDLLTRRRPRPIRRAPG